jgi:hypothetical protein
MMLTCKVQSCRQKVKQDPQIPKTEEKTPGIQNIPLFPFQPQNSGKTGPKAQQARKDPYSRYTNMISNNTRLIKYNSKIPYKYREKRFNRGTV